jgi:transmembrane sensor
LQRGEAFFEVAKDTDRPFTVVGPHAQARAVGTAYSVRLDEAQNHMQIKVTSGRVAIELPPSILDGPLHAIRAAWPGTSNGTYVDAHQEAIVRIAASGRDRGQVQVSIRDLPPDACERSLMWREGMLAFEGDTLNDAITEFARYSRQKIQLQGSLPRERVSGLFNAADPSGFARAIAISLKAKIKTENDTIILYK